MLDDDAQWDQAAYNAKHDLALFKGAQGHILWASIAFLTCYAMTKYELFESVDADHSVPSNGLQNVTDDQTIIDTAQHLDIPKETCTNASSRLQLIGADLKDRKARNVDLHAPLADVFDDLSSRSEQVGVAIETCLYVEHFQSQPMRLRQVMENLIANSSQYHAPEREEHYVGMRSSQTDTGIVMAVKDNGHGIPKGESNRTFERVARYNADSDGSGLGLAIVRKKNDALSGRIDVDRSDPARPIRITLPAAKRIEARL